MAYIPEPDLKRVGEELSNISITEEEVLEKLKKLNPSKSPGPDGMHPRVLKETADAIAKPLTIIFNMSLQEGRLPSDWKIAHVTALFKKGKHSSAGNYRPVSLTSVVCKLQESIIRDHMMKYLDDRELLSEDQHGFRAGRSCVTQLLEIVEIWTSMLDEGGAIDVVYLDFKKAFDSVPHQRLLKKLAAYGFQGKVLQSRVTVGGKFLDGKKTESYCERQEFIMGRGHQWHPSGQCSWSYSVRDLH